jgi:ABC-type uncharacterized transport system fused permease/ATPase subunit
MRDRNAPIPPIVDKAQAEVPVSSAMDRLDGLIKIMKSWNAALERIKELEAEVEDLRTKTQSP